jgi:hypothetical protein
MTTTEQTGIEEALGRYKGKPALLADAIQEPRTTVIHWLKTGIVPAEKCRIVEQVTLVPSERLNPRIDWAWYRNRPRPGAAT